jgi:hypothetical protein
MSRIHQSFFVGIVICGLVGIPVERMFAGTIIKLSLGGDSVSDIEFSGGLAGVLNTEDDLDSSTTGDQNTAVEFLDFLDSVAADIITPTASFTLDGLTATGPATVISGSVVLQTFAGGTLSLYDDDAANTPLLTGMLATSALTGPIGPPATGALFTTTFALVTGGTLAPYIDPTSLSLSMSLSDVNGGAGFVVFPPPAVPPPPLSAAELGPFTADASLNIAGEFSGIPEPASIALSLVGLAMSLLAVRRTRR